MTLPTTLAEIVELLKIDQTAWLRLSHDQRIEILNMCRDNS